MTVTPEIILGPPGTGKTTTLLGIVDEELIKGTNSRAIGYVSFTKRAAREATERACKKFNLERKDLPHFRTLHSMCFNMLGLSNSDVFEGKKVLEFSKWIGQPLSEFRSMEEGSTYGYEPGDRAMFMENLARVKIISLGEQFAINNDDLTWTFVNWIADNLKKYKRSNDLLDYTDMLAQFVAHPEAAPRLEVLIIDEAQDLSRLQWQVVARLATSVRRLVIACDDDQAIYRWAGADVDTVINMRGKVRVLDQSWRVPRKPQRVSNAVIAQLGTRRRPKVWRPRDSDGTVDYRSAFEHIDIPPGQDTLILVRNAYVARDVVLPELQERALVYEYQGHSSIRQSSLDAVITWEKLRRGEKVPVEDILKVYDMMRSGTGVKRGYKNLPGAKGTDLLSLPDLLERGGLMREDIWHQALDRLPLLDTAYMLRALQKGQKLTGAAKVHVSTIHGAKGAEADHVVVLREMAKRTYEEMVRNSDDEARVWYVAVTRARERLSIVDSRNDREYGL